MYLANINVFIAKINNFYSYVMIFSLNVNVVLFINNDFIILHKKYDYYNILQSVGITSVGIMNIWIMSD